MRLRRMALAPRLDQVAILRKIIGYSAEGPVYAIGGADSEGGDSGGNDKGSKDGTGSKDGSDTGASGNDDDEEDEEGDPPKDPKQYKAWQEANKLRREAARRRVENKQLREQAEAQAKELEEIKRKDMNDLQKAQADAAKYQKTTEEQARRIENMQVELAFLKMPRDKFDWHDPGAALTLLTAEHRSDLTLNEDGTVDGLDVAVKALAKKHKFLLRTPGTKEGEDGNGDGKNGSTGGSFGNNDRGSGDARKAFQDKAVSRFRIN